MSEYRLTVTMAEHGWRPDAEDNGERLLDAFVQVHPEVGPVVAGDMRVGTLDVTFSLDAADAEEALDLGRKIYAEGLLASGLRPTPVVGIHVEVVEEDDLALQAA
jgi:hypothetical protein